MRKMLIVGMIASFALIVHEIFSYPDGNVFRMIVHPLLFIGLVYAYLRLKNREPSE